MRKLLRLSAQDMNNFASLLESFLIPSNTIAQLFARTVHQEIRSDTTAE